MTEDEIRFGYVAFEFGDSNQDDNDKNTCNIDLQFSDVVKITYHLVNTHHKFIHVRVSEVFNAAIKTVYVETNEIEDENEVAEIDFSSIFISMANSVIDEESKARYI